MVYTKESQILDLATLFFDSFQYQTELLPSDFGEFVINTCLNANVEMDRFDSEEELREDWQRTVEDNPQAWFILYAYSKGYISKDDVKQTIKGKIWGTCCYGVYIKKLEEEFGVIINPDNKSKEVPTTSIVRTDEDTQSKSKASKEKRQ